MTLLFSIILTLYSLSDQLTPFYTSMDHYGRSDTMTGSHFKSQRMLFHDAIILLSRLWCYLVVKKPILGVCIPSSQAIDYANMGDFFIPKNHSADIISNLVTRMITCEIVIMYKIVGMFPRFHRNLETISPELHNVLCYEDGFGFFLAYVVPMMVFRSLIHFPGHNHWIVPAGKSAVDPRNQFSDKLRDDLQQDPSLRFLFGSGKVVCRSVHIDPAGTCTKTTAVNVRFDSLIQLYFIFAFGNTDPSAADQYADGPYTPLWPTDAFDDMAENSSQYSEKDLIALRSIAFDGYATSRRGRNFLKSSAAPTKKIKDAKPAKDPPLVQGSELLRPLQTPPSTSTSDPAPQDVAKEEESECNESNFLLEDGVEYHQLGGEFFSQLWLCVLQSLDHGTHATIGWVTFLPNLPIMNPHNLWLGDPADCGHVHSHIWPLDSKSSVKSTQFQLSGPPHLPLY